MSRIMQVRELCSLRRPVGSWWRAALCALQSTAMRREEHHPLKSPVHKELLCLPATHQLGNGADSVQEITDFEPQRGAQLSAPLAPNSFPVLCHTVKNKKYLCWKPTLQTKEKSRFVISRPLTIHGLRRLSCVIIRLSLPGIIPP